jgi:hypothetical protein
MTIDNGQRIGLATQTMAEQGTPAFDPRQQLGRGEDRVGLPVQEVAPVETTSVVLNTRGAEPLLTPPTRIDPFEQYRDRTGGHA